MKKQDRWMPSDLPAYYLGKRYWLAPDGSWIDCNDGRGHLSKVYHYCKNNNIPTIGKWSSVMYDAGFVRIVILDKVHCEYYKELTRSQLSELAKQDLPLWNDCADLPLEI